MAFDPRIDKMQDISEDIDILLEQLYVDPGDAFDILINCLGKLAIREGITHESFMACLKRYGKQYKNSWPRG